MSGAKRECRKILEDIWSSWPEPENLPRDLMEHARACPACRLELESFRELCRRSSERGVLLGWSAVLPESRFRRLASATLRGTAPQSSRPWIWTPAFALAAAVVAVLWTRTPLTRTQKPGLEVPAEVLANPELFEHLDLVEDWDVIEGLAPERGRP